MGELRPPGRQAAPSNQATRATRLSKGGATKPLRRQEVPETRTGRVTKLPKRETQNCQDARQFEEPDCEVDRLSSRGKRLPRSQQTPVNTTAGVAGLPSREIRPPGSQRALEDQAAG